jgi:hypothetical protein
VLAASIATPLAFVLAYAENEAGVWTNRLQETTDRQGSSVLSEVEASLIEQGVTQAKGLLIKPITALLSWMAVSLTRYERRYTRTDYEQSLFFKFGLIIVLNEGLLSMIAGYGRRVTAGEWDGELPKPNPPYQTFGWYADEDSVMASQLTTVVASALVILAQLLQPDMLINRYIRARWVRTQEKLDQLWAPPQLSLGDYYATLTMIVALGILYGPPMPIVYLLTAMLLFLLYHANKFLLLRVYDRPPMLHTGLSQIFQRYLWLTTVLSQGVQLLVYGGVYELIRQKMAERGIDYTPEVHDVGIATTMPPNATDGYDPGRYADDSFARPPPAAYSSTGLGRQPLGREPVALGVPLLGLAMLCLYQLLPTHLLPWCR